MVNVNNINLNLYRTFLTVAESDSFAEAAEEKSREILSQTMQKCAIEQVIETSVCVVSLPSDEMKGRIIGREGRNIRTLETLTGVDLIIDDTPEAVVLSSFDPIRREIAKLTIEKLIQDGRIHPVRIEEVYEKATKEIENKMKQENERLKKINIFRRKQKNITPIENNIDYQHKENKKDKDDFDISR